MSSKRVLFACIMLVAILIALDELHEGRSPQPRAFIAAYVVYVALALGMQFGPGAARVSSALGMLVALGVALVKVPGLLGLSNFLARQAEPTEPTDLEGTVPV